MSAASQVINSEKILDWCFTVGALILSALGFLYSIYATAWLNRISERATKMPPVLGFVAHFCRALVGVMVVLSGIAIFEGFQVTFNVSVWLIIGCLVVLTAYSLLLVSK